MKKNEGFFSELRRGNVVYLFSCIRDNKKVTIVTFSEVCGDVTRISLNRKPARELWQQLKDQGYEEYNEY